MSNYVHDKVLPHEDSKLTKKEQVSQMFDNIAPRYDFMNHFLSMGIDKGWRKNAIAQLIHIKPETVLDVATGTGDLAILTYTILHPKKVVGIDISEGMLELGRIKLKERKLNNVIEFTKGDAENVLFPDASFDAVTVAFGVRNFQDLEKGLTEMLRVLKPGGKVVILEFSKPKQPPVKAFYNLYMNRIAPFFGKLFAKNKEAYQYLNNSINAFPEREELLRIMKKCGYAKTYYKPQTMGICCIYCGSKN